MHFKCFMRSFERARSRRSKRYTSFWSMSDWLMAIDMMLVCGREVWLSENERLTICSAEEPTPCCILPASQNIDFLIFQNFTQNWWITNSLFPCPSAVFSCPGHIRPSFCWYTALWPLSHPFWLLILRILHQIGVNWADDWSERLNTHQYTAHPNNQWSQHDTKISIRIHWCTATAAMCQSAVMSRLQIRSFRYSVGNVINRYLTDMNENEFSR